MEQLADDLINNIPQTVLDPEVINFLRKKQVTVLSNAIKEYLKTALSANSMMYSGSINTLIPQLLPQEIDSVVELINNGLILKPLIRPKVYSIVKSLENPSEIIRNSDMYKSIQKEIQQAKDAIENCSKNIKEYWSMTSALELTKEHVPQELPSGYQVHLIGDLEGDATMIYAWFLQMNYIDQSLNWIAPDNVFIVQLGDQVDIAGRRTRTKEQISTPDYWVIVFFDYLNWKSKGRVMSVLGNHEFLNLDLDFRYVAPEHLSDRIGLFSKSGIIRNILERRNYILIIGPLVCCHAGLTEGVVKFISESKNMLPVKEIASKINSVSLDEYPRNSEDQTYSVIWTREYMNTSQLSPRPLSDFIQNYLTSQEKSMVIGHNSYNSIFYCSNSSCSDKFTKETRLIQADSGAALESCSTNVKVSTCLVTVVQNKIGYVSTHVFEWNCQKNQTVPNLLQHAGEV